jgi:hypothetical protein
VDQSDNGKPFVFQFKNCLIRSTNLLEADLAHYPDVKRNQDPMFITQSAGENETYNYRLNEGSPAIDAGYAAAGVPDDLDDEIRTGVPDIGCYEK